MTPGPTAAILALTLASGTPQQAEVPALDAAFARIRAAQPGPAVAIAVLAGETVVYRNVAGFADLERQVPATLDTRFDWASIAKQFTAFAVSLLVEEGRLEPTDRVKAHLPEIDLGGAPITIAHLLHHTAGLEDADGLLALAGGQPGDPVTLAAMARLVLGQRHVRSAPGAAHAYSNAGYVLLAEMVARLTGENFALWSERSIFRPLGMSRAGFLATPDQLVPDRALPYVPNRAGAGYLQSVLESTPGPGGLFATVGDLVTWARHLMSPARNREATLRLRERGALSSGEPLNYAWGLGWGDHRGQPTLSHSGSGPATNAFLLLFPDLGFAVAAASAGDTDPSIAAMAYAAADHFLADRLAPVRAAAGGPRMLMMTHEMLHARPSESTGVAVDPAVLAGYAGTYRLEDGTLQVVRSRGDQLEFAWGGRQPYVPLFPLPDGRFVMVPLWNAYRFLTDGAGRVTGLAIEKTPQSLRQDGPERVLAERLVERRFDAEAAAPYVGLYFSDELGALYEVAHSGDRLELRHARHGVLRLVPLEGDAFAVESRLIAAARFGRLGDAVVGLELEAVSWGARSSFRKLPAPRP